MSSAKISIGRLKHTLQPLLWRMGLAVRPVQRELFRAVLLGLLRSPGPYVSDVARTFEDERFGPTLLARERRILRLIESPKVSLDDVKAAERDLVAEALPDRGRVFLYGDLSDLSKPYARKLEGLDRVRDASDPDERIRPGYWLNEVYVELAPGRVLPVVLELYSLRSGRQRSETEVLLRGIEEAFSVTGPRGVFVGDRGFDRGTIFKALLTGRHDFAIRLQVGENSRRLLIPGEMARTVAALLEDFPLDLLLFDRRELRRHGWLGFKRVRLPDHPDRDLTLIVAHMIGKERPLVLLTSLRVRTATQARRAVAAYLRRWGGAEDPVRFLKQDYGMERILLQSLDAMKMWVFLQGVAMALLGFLLHPGRLRGELLRQVEHFKEVVRFNFYRACRAVSLVLQGLSPPRYRSLLQIGWA